MDINDTKRNKQCKFTIEEEKQIISEYLKGDGTTILGRRYQVDPVTIHNILKAYKIQTRTLKEARNTKIKINEQAFNPKYDNPSMAYWLGVMYSDGYLSCVNKYTAKFGIAVQQSDIEWLRQFKQYLEYNGKIHTYIQTQGFGTGTPYARLLIGNNSIVQDLKSWGMQEKKSLKPTHIPDTKHKLNFIYGYIDGNGSIHKKNHTLFISGEKTILQDIANYLQLPYHIYDDKSIGNLSYSPLNAKIIYNHILSLNCKYGLQRKLDLMSINQ